MQATEKKRKGKKQLEGAEKFNRVSPVTNVLFSAICIILALVCVIPAVFTCIISFSTEASIAHKGYSFFPEEWSINAYKYLWRTRESIGSGLLISVSLAIFGTLCGLFFCTTLAYPLSRRSFKLRGFFTMMVFIPMLFSGGMVSSYLIITQVLHLKNTYFALLLPLCCSTWNIIILRTFFQSNIPDEIIESGKVDGASQLRIFVQLVLPISLPGLATIGLFLTFAYWNEWLQSKLYTDSSHTHLFTLQYWLIMIEENIRFLVQNQNMITDATAGQNLPSETIRMAICMVVVLPIACSYPFFQRYFISGLTIGAVKG